MAAGFVDLEIIEDLSGDNRDDRCLVKKSKHDDKNMLMCFFHRKINRTGTSQCVYTMFHMLRTDKYPLHFIRTSSHDQKHSCICIWNFRRYIYILIYIN